MINDVAKAHLHDHLRWVREALVWKLDGLSEYDVRRPLTSTGTNLLGLVKHSAIWDSRYFGEVFDRPFPEALPRWDDASSSGTDFWATEHESRADISDLYQRVWSHTDATIEALDLDVMGYVPWWREEVPLFNVMLHCLYNGRTPDAYRQELRGFSRQKSMRITTRRLVGAAIWRMPALAKMLRLPTCSSPHVISTPGCVTIA
jgi:hypothetical protein